MKKIDKYGVSPNIKTISMAEAWTIFPEIHVNIPARIPWEGRTEGPFQICKDENNSKAPGFPAPFAMVELLSFRMSVHGDSRQGTSSYTAF